MYRDLSSIEEYPYSGYFYTVVESASTSTTPPTPSDGSLLDEGEEDSAEEENEESATEEKVFYETRCDIQEATKSYNDGSLVDGYNVFFPYPTEDILDAGGNILVKAGETNVRRGLLFKGSLQGMTIQGTVLAVFPTTIGVKCAIKEVDVS
jgi:hypothetical protein